MFSLFIIFDPKETCSPYIFTFCYPMCKIHKKPVRYTLNLRVIEYLDIRMMVFAQLIQTQLSDVMRLLFFSWLYQFSDISYWIILKLRRVYTIIYLTNRIVYFPLIKGQEILGFAATVSRGKVRLSSSQFRATISENLVTKPCLLSTHT